MDLPQPNAIAYHLSKHLLEFLPFCSLSSLSPNVSHLPIPLRKPFRLASDISHVRASYHYGTDLHRFFRLPKCEFQIHAFYSASTIRHTYGRLSKYIHRIRVFDFHAMRLSNSYRLPISILLCRAFCHFYILPRTCLHQAKSPLPAHFVNSITSIPNKQPRFDEDRLRIRQPYPQSTPLRRCLRRQKQFCLCRLSYCLSNCLRRYYDWEKFVCLCPIFRQRPTLLGMWILK